MDDQCAALATDRFGMQLYNAAGRRLYLTDVERAAFRSAVLAEPIEVRLFCLVVLETGCRLSEALGLTGAQIDPVLGVIVFETLKRRRRGVFRHVPIPAELSADLAAFTSPVRVGPIWPASRSTGWRWIKRVMARAGITGPQATAKGLRHGFAIAAVQADVPLNLVQRWLGHAQLSTTAIYTSAFGPEERGFAERMWDASSP